MTKKDIKQIINEHVSNLNVSSNIDSTTLNALKEFFVEGALWRVKTVWHPANETPRDNSLILCKAKDNEYFLYGKSQRYYKEMSEDVEMWAYIKDLIPSEEEQI